ncbi:extracellular solute-binding protein [Leeia sp. TBRC 13508]|uniref:Putrescine-binding periplasmic protein n=1 Tax=Leeia speluncae TaxID=2884804 RepID=A0ABS8D659_9NEIS|nr:extracellular solute-binding protein [Leeia speluncae]MCB6183108.1 extracellular solute-binding protein [Leeia speluncae]
MQAKKWVSGFVFGALVASCAFANEEPVLNVYNWADYFGATTLQKFEKETGIKVRYDKYDSNEALQAKLLSGNSGYDLVFPSSQFFARQVKAGVFYKLDKAKLPNLKNLDAGVLAQLSALDAGNQFGMPYAQGTNGITINVEKVNKALGGKLPADPLALVFDPQYASKLSSCGISFFDSASEMYTLAFSYMGKDLATATDTDLKAAEGMLKKIRPYVRKFIGIPTQQMASGEFCVAMDYSGDAGLAASQAKAAKNGVNIAYLTPKQHTPFWIDMMAIPKDAKHPENAQKFMNFLMKPEIISELTHDIFYATPNTKTAPFLTTELRNNTAIFPTPEMKKQFVLVKPLAPEQQRKLIASFNVFKTSK